MVISLVLALCLVFVLQDSIAAKLGSQLGVVAVTGHTVSGTNTGCGVLASSGQELPLSIILYETCSCDDVASHAAAHTVDACTPGSLQPAVKHRRLQ
jgi:hypothetical protein